MLKLSFDLDRVDGTSLTPSDLERLEGELVMLVFDSSKEEFLIVEETGQDQFLIDAFFLNKDLKSYVQDYLL